MCTIDKMLIKGIRSFSPDNDSVISFFKPLTLIVGPNGAGKTTIIECLKHATTGELPPNSRSGHTFIHDPKVAGETETKGQIKLRFKTATGRDVVCIRSFQLTQKAAKMEYKAIESVLQTINPSTGEKVCLSYRCADMDREVPLLMGVSKAVLENVIFVHQDEANWPLADPATLKKKFDDIFSATKYTKAMESMKKVHKEQAQQIKEMRLKQEHLRTLKEAAARLQGCVEGDRARVAELQGHIAELEGKISAARQRQAGLEESLREVRSLGEQARVVESRREMLVRQRIQQYSDLEVENEDTDEELAQWQRNFEVQVGTLRLKMARAEREVSDARVQLERLKEQQQAEGKVQGRLQAEGEMHREDCAQRDSILADVFQGHKDELLPLLPSVHRAQASRLLTGAHGVSSSLPADLAEAATEAVMSHVEGQQKALRAVKVRNKEEVGRVTAECEGLAEQVRAAETAVQLSAQRKADCTVKLEQVRSNQKEAEFSERDLEKAGQRERVAKDEMERLAASLRDRQLESAIEDTRTELFGAEQKLRGVQREREQLMAESADRVTLRIKKDSLREKEQAKEKVSSEYMPRIKKLFPSERNPPTDPDRLAAEVQRVVDRHRSALGKVEGESQAAGNEVAGLGMRLEDAKRDLAVKQQELEEKKAALMEGMFQALSKRSEEARLDEELKRVQASAEKAKGDHDQLAGMRKIFSRFARDAETKHCCPVCERPFQGDQEIQHFVAQQNRKQETSWERLEQLSSQWQEMQAKAEWLERLRPVYLEHRVLQEKGIPEARRAVDEGERALSAAREAHEDLVASLAEEKVALERAELAFRGACELERVAGEAEAVRKEVEEQGYKLDVLSQNLRSMADITADVSALEGKREECSKRLEGLREEQQQLKEEVASSNLRWRNAREDRTALEHRMARALQLRDEAGELESTMEQMGEAMQAAEERLSPLLVEHERLLRERERALKSVEEAEHQQQLALRDLQRQGDQLKTVWERIQQHVAAGKEAKLAEVSARLERLGQQQAEQETLLSELSAAVSQDQELLRSQALVKRNIDDNVAYRKTLKEEAAAREDVEGLQRKLVEAGNGDRLSAEAESTGREIEQWLAEQNKSRGTVGAQEANISRNTQELKQAQYRDIEGRYRKQLIQLRTLELANKDLERYSHALDQALMRFHAMKMSEINRTVKELWQQTYRGQDIDLIEIRSDAEGGASRSYSYRVVMRNGDAELDMRGRCSAGQKVLASLVIRLALAETFCLRCGILALDEPTTNLDGPNAESLAAALLRLVEERRNQESFQLVVITHDERFAQLIGQKEYADKYYRVSKDDAQRSRIQVQDIFE